MTLDWKAGVDAGRDLLLMTLDTLRYDVAEEELAAGRLPNLGRLLGLRGWERRHAPGSFTYASHAAIFAGFFPTPAEPGVHVRPMALDFQGSTTIGPRTALLPGASVPEGLALRGYRTLCVGGVGFFNRQNPLGEALPSLFQEAVWEPGFGVTALDSTARQLRWAARWLEGLGAAEPAFVFVNVSALHQPNRGYVPGLAEDTLASHAAALRYVDRQLPILINALWRRGAALCMVGSDHGTAYGEDGYTGHRLGHEVVWTVPWAELELSGPLPQGAAEPPEEDVT